MASLSDFAIWPVLAASDPGRAKKWYEEKLGLTPKREDETGGMWYEFAGGTWLLMYRLRTPVRPRTLRHTSRLRTWSRWWTPSGPGGVVLEEYDFGEMGKTENGIIEVMGWKTAWFKDSEGNTFEIAQPPGA
jgi:catechol 2,3-dioxygenase-like lactoylglutathione lyase family enzyme